MLPDKSLYYENHNFTLLKLLIFVGQIKIDGQFPEKYSDR